MGGQLRLTDILTFNIERQLAETMADSAKKSGLSREDIVNQMNYLADQFGVELIRGKTKTPLSIDTFEKWLNPNDCSRCMPIRAIPIFCKVVNDAAVIDVIAKPLGINTITEDDKALLAWAKAYRRAHKARQELKRLEPVIDQ